MKKYIICLIGHDQIGKTSISSKIAELYELDTITLSLATPLKKQLASIGVPVYFKPYSNHTRIACRAYADVMMEQHGDNYWVDQLFTEIDRHQDKSLIIVDDVRQIHEVRAIGNKYYNTKQDRHLMFINLTTDTPVVNHEHEMFRSVKEVDAAQQVASNSYSGITFDRDKLTKGLNDTVRLYNDRLVNEISFMIYT